MIMMNYYNLIKRYNNEVIKPIQKVQTKFKDRVLAQVQQQSLLVQLKVLLVLLVIEAIEVSIYSIIGYFLYTMVVL